MNSCSWTLSFSPFRPTPCHLLSPFIISTLTSTGLLSPLSCPPLSVLACPPLSMVVADSDFASKMKNRQMGLSGGMNMTKSTSLSGDMCNLEKTDGSQSDTAVGTVGTDEKKRRSSIGAKMQAMVGMSRKSRSTSQLSQTGRCTPGPCLRGFPCASCSNEVLPFLLFRRALDHSDIFLRQRLFLQIFLSLF